MNKPVLPELMGLEVLVGLSTPVETDLFGTDVMSAPYGIGISEFTRFWGHLDSKKSALHVIEEQSLVEVESEMLCGPLNGPPAPTGKTVVASVWRWNERPVDVYLPLTVITLLCPSLTFLGRYHKHGRTLFPKIAMRPRYGVKAQWERLQEFKAELLRQFDPRS